MIKQEERKMKKIHGIVLAIIGIIAALFGIVLRPVSYTHLDVYKRQEWNGRRSYHRKCKGL